MKIIYSSKRQNRLEELLVLKILSWAKCVHRGKSRLDDQNGDHLKQTKNKKGREKGEEFCSSYKT